MPRVTSGWPNRAFRCHPDGARHRRLAPATERKAVDGGDHRLTEVFDEGEDVLPIPARPLGLDGREVSDLADVRSRDERFVSRPGEDDTAHRGIITRALERGSQVLPRSLIQRVEHLGPIEGHIRDAVLLLVQKVLEGRRGDSRAHQRVPCPRYETPHTKALSPVTALPTMRFCI